MELILFILITLFILAAASFLIRDEKRKSGDNTDTSGDYPYQTIHPHPQYDEQKAFGVAGEEYVGRTLDKIARENGGYLFNNFTFMDELGYSTNIDHILITRGGVFVIETKANKGIISGEESDEYWTAIKEEWQEDKTFRNPVIQNRRHINHLRRMLGQNAPKMYSLVVFPAAASLRRVNSAFVHDLRSAQAFITEKNEEPRYQDKTVEKIYNDLLRIKNLYGISLEEHLENLNDKYVN